MINETDLEAFGYFDMFQNSPDYSKDPVRFYSQFVGIRFSLREENVC